MANTPTLENQVNVHMMALLINLSVRTAKPALTRTFSLPADMEYGKALGITPLSIFGFDIQR